MKPKILVIALTFFLLHSAIYAQSKRPDPSKQALLFADSLVQAFRNNNWEQYISISYPGVVQYYGGTQSFREYVRRTRTLNADLAENPEKIALIQIAHDRKHEWQCVIKKSRETFVDGKKAQVVSYMIGQSTDQGQNWKYFDVAYNSVENVMYIMPDVFNSLSIPNRQIIYETNFASAQ